MRAETDIVGTIFEPLGTRLDYTGRTIRNPSIRIAADCLQINDSPKVSRDFTIETKVSRDFTIETGDVLRDRALTQLYLVSPLSITSG